VKTLLVTITALAITTGLAAQTAGKVVPSASATTNPGYWDTYATYGTTATTFNNEGRAQYLYDSADVGDATVWKSIAWRRPQLLGNPNAATTFSMTIIMSNSPVAYNAPSSTFTANHGTKASGTPAQTVLNTQVSLPGNSRGGTWPEPWLTAFPISVFVHAPVKGGSLVIECISTDNSQKRIYYCEGHQLDIGKRVTTVNACWSHSDGGRNDNLGYRLPVIGGSWFANYANMPSNEPNLKKSLNIIGLNGPGQTAFGKTLPIPINTLGFLDICANNAGGLANDLVLVQPLTYTTSTVGPSRGALRSPTVNIPNDPKLGGVSFFAQAFCTDKPLNGYDQIYMGWGSEWTIGSNTGPKGSVVYRSGNNASATGVIRNGYGRTMLLK